MKGKQKFCRIKSEEQKFYSGFKNCTFALVLDKRTNRKDCTSFPLSIRFTVDRKIFYHRVGSNYTEKEFSDITTVGKSKSDKYELQKQWKDLMDFYKNLLQGLNKGKDLDFDTVKSVVMGNTQ